MSSSRTSCLCRPDGRSTSRSVVENIISIIIPRLRTGRIRSRKRDCPQDGKESSLLSTAFIMSSEWIWKKISQVIDTWTRHDESIFFSAISRARRNTNTRVTRMRCNLCESCRHHDTPIFTLTVF